MSTPVDQITRTELALLLEQEQHTEHADRIRGGADPTLVLSDGRGGVSRTLRLAASRDLYSREAVATFDAILTGHLAVAA